MYDEYRAGLAAVPADGRGRYVADWLRKTSDAKVMQHACAMAQTLFRAGDLDGYLEILGGFLDAHPRAVEPASQRSWLAILGRYPYHGRTAQDPALAARYVIWIRDRLVAGDHPALAETLGEFLFAIAGSGEIVSECLRLVEEARYPDECRERVRVVHCQALLGALPHAGTPARRETLARRGLLWHPEEIELQRALVGALVDQGRHADAVALGIGWLRADQTDLALLRGTLLALDGAGHAPEAIELFLRYGPGVTGEWEFPRLLLDVLGQYRRLGREHDALRDLEPFFEPPRSAEVTVAVAALHARNGFDERALHFVRLALETFDREAPIDRAVFRTADFESLRGTAEFLALIA